MSFCDDQSLKRKEKSWVLYDVGNSAFVLVIVTAIMPIFFKEYAAVDLLQVDSTALWGFANSGASLIIAILSPLLGVMADYRLLKKQFFLVFLCLGLFATASFVAVGAGSYMFCLVLFIFARVGWSGANLFYDAFLLDVTRRDRLDLISARGYGYGYIGSVIPFVVIIGLILSAGLEHGMDPGQVKIGFIIVVLWWGLFSIPLIKNVHQTGCLPNVPSPIKQSFKRLKSTLNTIYQQKNILYFLLAYFFYIDGVSTIISMSTAYGIDLGFGVGLLIGVLLFIQIVAFPFSIIYGRLAEKYGTRRMLFAGVSIYFFITILAFSLPWIESQTLKVSLFWVIAFLVASSMGGLQALSRSFFARLIPEEKSAEYFGFYNVFGKFAAISGPFLMAFVATLTGDSRWGVLSICILFVLGLFFLLKVEE